MKPRKTVVAVLFGGGILGGLYFSQPRYGCTGVVNQAETGTRLLRSAASQWQLAENNNSQCPNVSELIRDQQLDVGQSLLDPWDNDYRIECTDGEVTVTSAGADETFGTSDDLASPQKRIRRHKGVP